MPRDFPGTIVFIFNMLPTLLGSGYRHHEGVLPGMPPTDDPANCLALWYRVAAMISSIGRRAVSVCAIPLLLYTLGGCTTASPPPGSRGLPAPIREVLPNGMRLIIQEHRAAATVAIHLWTGVGGRDEAVGERGFSHFAEHMLFKGTETRPRGFVDSDVEGVGGRTNAGTSNDYTFYYLLLPAARTLPGIALMADMVINSVFDPTELARERDVVFEEVRLNEDNPRSSLGRQLYNLLYQGHPYGRPVLGDAADLRGATQATLRGYYKRHYVPENMALVVVGPVSPAEVRAAAVAAFGAGRIAWAETQAPAQSALGLLAGPLYQQLAALKGSDDAVVFGSGYLTNIGVIPALVGSADLILIDELCHSCLLAGAELSRGRVIEFRHNDVTHATQVLAEQRARRRHCLVVTDGVFSMEGDLAPLPALAAVAQRYDAWLMTDDAHGLGVVGDGRGSTFAHGARVDVPVQMGTLSKAAGGYGGYLCASRSVVELVRNRARSFVYSTGLPPGAVAAASRALDIIATDRELVRRPLAHARLFTAELGLAPAWMVVVVIGREFAVSGLRSIGSGRGIVIPASGWGKAKMFTQIGAVSLLILALRHEMFALPGRIALWVVVAVALISGTEYFAKFLRGIVISGPVPGEDP